MEINSKKKIYFPIESKNTYTTVGSPSLSTSLAKNSQYDSIYTTITSTEQPRSESTIELVAMWFLYMSSMSNKKLQKMCYYAYCWFIVFFNDIELITEDNCNSIRVLCADRFQAWIHGPVSPRLYGRYKEYGWRNIPKSVSKPTLPDELESLLQQVWDAYGSFTADELESISHEEMPWKNARKGINNGEACSNEISDYDILKYYSSLG